MRALDYEGLYEAYYMQVYSFLMARSGDRALAEELTAQTFYKAMTGPAFRGEGSPLTWLCAIAKNLYADELRRRARQGGADPEEAAEFGTRCRESRIRICWTIGTLKNR